MGLTEYEVALVFSASSAVNGFDCQQALPSQFKSQSFIYRFDKRFLGSFTILGFDPPRASRYPTLF